MGLKEKRAVKDFQDNHYAEQKAAIDESAGFSVEVEVDWDAIAKDGMSHLYAEAWPQVYFTPVVEALKSICADDMGREALKDALKKIEITNSGSVSSANQWASFSDGVIKLDHEPTTNLHYTDERAKSLTKLLEDAL
ncbi:MAG: hypothetical protein AAFP04_14155 [Myxococcota bacterium]